MTKIPQVDPGAFYRAHKAEIDGAVARVLASGWYILGKEVAAFEREFAEAFAVGHGVGVASGTDALILSLVAAGMRPGDRVATASHTAVATVTAITLAGAEAVLVDIDPKRFTIDPEKLAATFEAIPGIKAVVAVHLYGQPADLPALLEVTRHNGVRLIEDCAQAHGAKLDGRWVGSFGDAAAYSFYPTKTLGAFGDGGLVATSDPEIAERARRLREYGWNGQRVSETVGMNSRLDELQAAILRTRLPKLAAGNARRRQIAAQYDRGLADTGLKLPFTPAQATHGYHQYVVRHPDRDRLQAKLRDAGIGTNIHYPAPVHLQPAYSGRVLVGPHGLGESEAAAREVLSLPMYPELEDEAVTQVIEAIRKALGAE
jgi:dTDP-4-amino-4,6-dideoxygalactose transaminase